MKMKKAALIAGILGAVIIGSSITITQQNEYKLIRQFGKVDRVISSSGISFKIPFIESTQSLPPALYILRRSYRKRKSFPDLFLEFSIGLFVFSYI